MLRINAEEARQEHFDRTALLRKLNAPESYNTGATVVAINALEYVGYLLNSGRTYIQDQSTRAFSATGAGSVLISEVRGLTATPVLLTPAAMVSAVRNTFHLTVSQAAEVFHVSRPTIYQWESLDDAGKIRARRDYDRIRKLVDLAIAWEGLGPLMGRWLTAILSNGETVLDLLRADQPDETALRRAHVQLSAAAAQLQEAEHRSSVEAATALADPFTALAEAEKRRANR